MKGNDVEIWQLVTVAYFAVGCVCGGEGVKYARTEPDYPTWGRFRRFQCLSFMFSLLFLLWPVYIGMVARAEWKARRR